MTHFLDKPALLISHNFLSLLVLKVDVVVIVLSHAKPHRLLRPISRLPKSCCHFEKIRQKNCRTYNIQDVHSHFLPSLGRKRKTLKDCRWPHRSSFPCRCKHPWLIVGTTRLVTSGIDLTSQWKGSAYPKSLQQNMGCI